MSLEGLGVRALNTAMLAEISRIPEGGGYRFEPSAREPTDAGNPRDPHYEGVRTALVVNSEPIARSMASGETYCCGITLEVWWRAWTQQSGAAPPLNVADARQLVTQWFCPFMGHGGVVAALCDRGWGTEVSLADARPGDLIQFWRSVSLHNPSGHSAVFLRCDAQTGGQTSLTYWSSQPATDGVGVHTEVTGPQWQIRIVRATIP